MFSTPLVIITLILNNTFLNQTGLRFSVIHIKVLKKRSLTGEGDGLQELPTVARAGISRLRGCYQNKAIFFLEKTTVKKYRRAKLVRKILNNVYIMLGYKSWRTMILG